MSVEIRRVQSRHELRLFVTFPERLYKDSPYWVPALQSDEYDTFNPRKNAAYGFCEADCFLAYRNGELVGRVAAILNRKADTEKQRVRFGWLDFTNDEEVLAALMDKVASWGRKRGCKRMIGPWGFTDMDKEGLLVEGFDKLCPFTCLYNHPYYDTLLTKLGFVKDVDWTQKVLHVSHELPSMFQFSNLIEERFGIHVVHLRSTRALGRKYGMAVFHMYNECFAPLYGFSPLTDVQIRNYLDTYVPILDMDFVALAVDSNDNPVGFIFCVPSLSKAVKKSGGKLFPLGILRILHALRHNDTLEALMIGVHPDYQNCGITVPMFKYIHENCIKRGIDRIILNPQLEENYKVQGLFGEYQTDPFMRRRAYTKEII